MIKDEPASIKPKSSKLKEEPIKPPKLEEKQIHQGQDTSQEYSSDHSENEQSDDSSESISSNSNTEIGVPEKRKKWMEESENFIFYRANWRYTKWTLEEKKAIEKGLHTRDEIRLYYTKKA